EEQPVPGEPAVGPPAEPAVPEPAAQSEGPPASGGFEAPPQPEPEPEVYQEAPDALPDSEEERRRQQEEAARAYERAREEQSRLFVELRAIRFEVDEAFALITLDRPDRLNAWTMRIELGCAWYPVDPDAPS